METNNDPGAALDEAARARVALADRLAPPAWYHPVLGAAVAQHAVAQGLSNRNGTLPSAVLLLVGCVAAVIAARRATGVVASRPVGPRSRQLLGLRFAAALVCIWAAALAGTVAVSVPIGVVAFAATVALGRRYDQAMAEDLGRPAGG